MVRGLFRFFLMAGLSMLLGFTAKAQDADRMYRIAKIKVAASQLEKYKAALSEQMNAAIKSEPGVLSYTAVADKKDATLIIILEVYANIEAYRSHILTPHLRSIKKR